MDFLGNGQSLAHYKCVRQQDKGSKANLGVGEDCFVPNGHRCLARLTMEVPIGCSWSPSHVRQLVEAFRTSCFTVKNPILLKE